ncbi:hypothetical protein RchiOBHm_Chr7g0242941 [Rosa chinensis]|uniref:Uncharacterized protein n=1 Tax=Rosa chinensis TaxID=74649 RepID=A0A2P6PIL9_ROSCH|nr:hypothetical protein RchiOBHm_Chr7g0242941 [Rosa chinensis]
MSQRTALKCKNLNVPDTRQALHREMKIKFGKSPVSPPSVVRLHPFVVSFLSLVSVLDLFMSLYLSIFPCSCPIVHQISRSTIKSHILLHLKHLTLSSSSEFSLFPQPHLHIQPWVSRQRLVHLTPHMKIAAVPANHRRLWTSPDQWCCDAWWSPPPRLPLLSSLFCSCCSSCACNLGVENDGGEFTWPLDVKILSGSVGCSITMAASLCVEVKSLVLGLGFFWNFGLLGFGFSFRYGLSIGFLSLGLLFSLYYFCNMCFI